MSQEKDKLLLVELLRGTVGGEFAPDPILYGTSIETDKKGEILNINGYDWSATKKSFAIQKISNGVTQYEVIIDTNPFEDDNPILNLQYRTPNMTNFTNEKVLEEIFDEIYTSIYTANQ
jgi:hypothetical protein